MSLKKAITAWLNELAEFMDPDTYNLFEPIRDEEIISEGVVLKTSVKAGDTQSR